MTFCRRVGIVVKEIGETCKTVSQTRPCQSGNPKNDLKNYSVEDCARKREKNA